MATKLIRSLSFHVSGLLRPYFNAGVPLPKRAMYLVPPAFAIGAAMETFMIHTGFCE